MMAHTPSIQQSEVASRLKVLLLILFYFITPSTGEIGTAASYNPQYTPHMGTACDKFSSPDMKRSIMVSASNFGSLNMQSIVFAAAAGEAIWENGASCGQIYDIACINPCTYGNAFKVMIVDRASTTRFRPSNFVGREYVLLLPQRVFEAIANPSAQSINIELVQVTPGEYDRESKRLLRG